MALVVQMRGVVVNVFEVILNVPVLYRVWNCNSHDFALLHKCFCFRVIDKRAHYFCPLNDVDGFGVDMQKGANNRLP